MMALVEQDSAGCVLAGARRIDHHECVVGDYDVRLATRAFGTFDEAAAVVRAASVHAFATAVRKRGRAGAPEQARQPAREIPTHHVAILAVGGPAADQLRKDGSTARKCALQRVLKVQQAEVILPAL